MLPDLRIWLDHFEYHAQRPRSLPQGLPSELTDEERRAIAASIAIFQLGEQSEGASLLRAARCYEHARSAAHLGRITELFIREEQHHAALLRTFMEQHAIPLKQCDWTDQVFRRLRRAAGFELHLCVLVTAELIGNVYYRALEAATDCRQLRMLCRTLVADELAHVAYESDLLLAMRARRSAPVRTAFNLLHCAFFTCASLVVWFTHRAVLRRAGHRMPTFLRACTAQYSFYLTLAAPRSARPAAAGRKPVGP